MSDLESRVKALEAKVKLLEETLETLINMQMSEKMESYLQTQMKTLKLVSLINNVSDSSGFDFSKEEESVKNIKAARASIERQIATAIKSSEDFSEQYPADTRYFNYEVEQGTESNNSYGMVIKELTPYVGKGIRITSYNGFESNRIVIPKEIEGKPVTTIGVNAFKNATFSEILLPSTLKVIMRGAFEGCKNLTQIDFPEGLEVLDSSCFLSSGLNSIKIPNSVIRIGSSCFSSCTNMCKVILGEKVRELGYCTFKDCVQLTTITLPESIVSIASKCFEGTRLSSLIIPSGTLSVACETFGDFRSVRPSNVVCAFLGKNTEITGKVYQRFENVSTIYCLPGSNVQKYAREKSIAMKPLSEYKMGRIQ